MSFLTRAVRLTQRTAALHTRAALRADAPKREAGAAPVLNLRFVHATETVVAKPVYMVTIPAVSGMMGILGDHAPTIAQLRPGVVTVHGNDLADVTHRYFVSGGFAEVKADSSASVQAVEAVRIEDLDAGQARKVLDEAQAALLKASGDLEKAQVQIQIEVAEAVLQALEAK